MKTFLITAIAALLFSVPATAGEGIYRVCVSGGGCSNPTSLDEALTLLVIMQQDKTIDPYIDPPPPPPPQPLELR